MKSSSNIFALIFVIFLICSCTTKTDSEPRQKADITAFTGQWTLDIKGESVGWLEVRQEKDYLDGDLLWISGSVNPVANVFLANDGVLYVTLTRNVVRKMDENKNPVRSQVVTNWLEINKQGDKIAGYLLRPRRNGMGVDSTSFTGTKLPPVPPAPDLSTVKFGKPIVLFNGKDLTEWKLINEKQKNGFKVVNGVLVCDPVQVEGATYTSYGHLRTVKEFEDFNLKFEVNIPERSNSGVFLRGMYEIQVLDSYVKDKSSPGPVIQDVMTHVLGPSEHVIPPSEEMGGVYSRINPAVKAEKPAGTWQTLNITLCDRHITVILNGTKIIDNQPVYGPTGGAIISDVFAPGPIYIQGDHGKAEYRNIVLTPIIK